MPHLCPTSWTAALVSFWLIFLTLNSMIWWLQLPKFPHLNTKNNLPSSPLWSWK